MKSLLVNTMQSFYGSPQGPARLYACARQAGMDVTFLNLNHDAYSYLLSTSFLKRKLVEARPELLSVLSRDRFLRRCFGSILLEASAGEIVRLLAEVFGDKMARDASWGAMPLARRVTRGLARLKLTRERLGLAVIAAGDEIAERVGAAQEDMDRRYFRQDPKDYLRLFRRLLCGKAIVDALHYPAQLDFGFGFWGREWGLEASEVIRATRDERHNYLLPFYRDQVMPVVRHEQPGLVGLSVTHGSEMIPIFTLARMIRDEMPDAHIVIGGAAIADIRDRIAESDCLWTCIDSLVYGPGEKAFPALAQALESGKPLGQVPNLMYRDAGSVRYSERTAAIDPDEVLTPEYVGLRPGAGIALETSSSCYWGKCAFCYYPRQGTSSKEYRSAPCRERSLDLVFEDMRTLKERYSPLFIGLTDSAVRPQRLREIARHSVESGLAVPFTAFVRLESEFASEEFCRKLAEGGFLGGQAGLESAAPRVNALIDKGIDLAKAPVIIRNFHRQGLLLHLYTLVGFPGETVKEAWNTYRFLRAHRDELALDWQVYSLWLLENGPLAENPDAFGLKNVQPVPRDLLVPLCTYEVPEGTMTQADSVKYSFLFEQKLDKYRHPLREIMDVEQYKGFLFFAAAVRRMPAKHGLAAGKGASAATTTRHHRAAGEETTIAKAQGELRGSRREFTPGRSNTRG